MKAIFTKYHGPTTNRGSRISASDSDGNRVFLSLKPEWNHDKTHQEAARALCNRMKWTGKLVQGSNGPNSEVFVWSNYRNSLASVIEV